VDLEAVRAIDFINLITLIALLGQWRQHANSPRPFHP
jgi:hypothetical protein